VDEDLLLRLKVRSEVDIPLDYTLGKDYFHAESEPSQSVSLFYAVDANLVWLCKAAQKGKDERPWHDGMVGLVRYYLFYGG
jgi:hypothetical protein